VPLYFPGCRVVGMDIGSRSIKVVQLQTTLTAYTITGFWRREHRVGTWEELAAELRSLCQEHGVRGDVYCTSFPGHRALFRNTEMPFHQVDKIGATIRFEAESIMAVPLDGMVVDFALIERGTAGTASMVLVTCVPEALLHDYARALAAADICPDTIDIDALALAHLIEELRVERGIVCLDVGAEKASITIFKNGRLRFIRCLPVEIGEKGSWKRLKPVVDEVLLSITAYQEGEPAGVIDEVWLTGGWSTIKELPDYLHERSGMPVRYLEEIKKFPSTVPVTEEMSLSGGVALGLALRGLRRDAGRVDLARRLADSLPFLTPVLRKRALHLGLTALVLVVFMALHFFVGVGAQERRYSAIKDEMHQVFHAAFPEAKGEGNEVQQASAIIKGMRERGVKSAATDEAGPLEMMREIVQLLPQEAKIVELEVEEERVTLRGMAASFAAVDEIKGALIGSPLFSEVKAGTVELGRRGEQGVVFTMLLTAKTK
jgi:Tfp pilus assembly PilM family ATPase/Tfp pilus assembly protein PilN